jgi:thiol-disulfide isomerase/thioredoxin
MKHIKRFSLFLTLVLGSQLLCCDVVKAPYKDSLLPPGGGGIDSDTAVVRKVLLEDFTGFYCGTCPPASEIANTLDSIYGDQLVIIGIHANFFADVSLHPVPYKEPDLRTPAGEELYNFFNVSSNPSGMVNRKPYGGGHVMSKDAWGAAVAQELALPPELRIKLTPTYNASDRVLNLKADVRYALPGSQYDRLVVMILESPVTAPQKDYRLPSPSNILDYQHKHVLRANINGTWGDVLNTGNVAAGTVVSRDFTYTLPAHIDASRAYIAAFVHRQEPDSQSDIKREVIQAEEVKMIP